MLAKAKRFVQNNAKAIVAALCSFVAMAWLHLTGHVLPPEWEKALESVLIAVIVWAVPNK